MPEAREKIGRAWLAPLAIIAAVNLWSIFPLLRWPFISSDAAIFSILSRVNGGMMDRFAFHLETVRDAYQPLISFLDAAAFTVFGAEPIFYRAAGILLYSIWALAVYFLTAFLTRSTLLGACSAILISFFPARLTMSPGYFESYVIFEGIFGMLFLYFTARGALRNSWGGVAVGLLCLIAKLLFRQGSGISWLALGLVFYYLVRTRDIPGKTRRFMVFSLLLSGVVVSVHLYVRLGLLGDRMPISAYVQNPGANKLEDLIRNGAHTLPFAPLWMAKAFTGWRAVFAQCLGVSTCLKFLAALILLLAAGRKLLSVHGTSFLQKGREKTAAVPLILLGAGIYLVGLIPTCVFRTPPSPEWIGRIDEWGTMQELYRPILAYPGLAWLALGVLSRAGRKAFRYGFLGLLAVFFILDSSYSRNPLKSPFVALALEMENNIQLRTSLRELPDGLRVAMWDTDEDLNKADVYPVKTTFFDQVQCFGHSKRWTVNYLGRKRSAVPPGLKWKEIVDTEPADLFIWHEAAGDLRWFVYDDGSIKAFSPQEGRIKEVVSFPRVWEKMQN